MTFIVFTETWKTNANTTTSLQKTETFIKMESSNHLTKHGGFIGGENETESEQRSEANRNKKYLVKDVTPEWEGNGVCISMAESYSEKSTEYKQESVDTNSDVSKFTKATRKQVPDAETMQLQ
jgi:hypothetical protein